VKVADITHFLPSLWPLPTKQTITALETDGCSSSLDCWLYGEPSCGLHPECVGLHSETSVSNQLTRQSSSPYLRDSWCPLSRCATCTTAWRGSTLD